MELFFVVLIGAAIGLVGHGVIPARHGRGAVLLPGVGAAVAAGVWAVLTWAGLPYDGTWIWAAAIVAPAVVVTVAGLAFRKRRVREDDAYFRSVVAGQRARSARS